MIQIHEVINDIMLLVCKNYLQICFTARFVAEMVTLAYLNICLIVLWELFYLLNMWASSPSIGRVEIDQQNASSPTLTSLVGVWHVGQVEWDQQYLTSPTPEPPTPLLSSSSLYNCLVSWNALFKASSSSNSVDVSTFLLRFWLGLLSLHAIVVKAGT